MAIQIKSQSGLHLDSRARATYARMVTRLLKHWRLSDADQLALLGFSEDKQTTLGRYRDGSPLSNTQDLLDRVAYLLDIHAQLRCIFPHNRKLVYGWMTARIVDFNYLTPLEVIKLHGIVGMNMLSVYLASAREE